MQSRGVWLWLLALLCLCVIAPDPAAARSRTHVYLLRGIFNVSVGLDALAGKLTRRGIAASVYGHGDVASVADAAIRDYRGGTRSIVLIGHSLGAGAAVEVAQRLQQARVPVTLLISLDPVGNASVPHNVHRAVNFYVSGTQLAGATNVNVSGIPGMDHMAVQSMETMHQRILGYLR
jgi:pimeloyl-ACP methyl ester carboxylesterase